MAGTAGGAAARRVRPGDAAWALCDRVGCALLESADGGTLGGRYSYLTAEPFAVIRARGREAVLERADGSRERAIGDPFGALRRWLAPYARPARPGLPPFQGGAVGYFAYDVGRVIERLPSRAADDLGWPELWLGLYDWVYAYDHAAGRGWLVGDGSPPAAAVRALEGDAPAPSGSPPLGGRLRGPASSTFSCDGYVAAVQRVREYIAAGDVFQVNLSRRITVPQAVDPWALYVRMRQRTPAPFAAYLRLPHGAVASASPELFLDLGRDGRVETRPIKGTRPRGASPDADRALAAALLASPKDRAENVMIVDLLRNDLGRVCAYGSVEVPRLWALESHPTVHHLVSTVTGRLAPGRDAIDLLRACLPGGSITGAPKVRAMEIIEELEPVRRSVYCGAVGWLGWDGAMMLNIAIRTALVTPDAVHVYAGGGVVADSDPAAEYEETSDKARALLMALGVE